MTPAPGERWYRRLLRLYPRDFRDEFGGEMTRLYRDRGRGERGWSLWSSLLIDLVRTAPSEHLAILRQDLRHAWRGLRRTPVITVTAMLTLALGVGASTAVFSIVHAVLLRPLPYPDPDALVELLESNLAGNVGAMRASSLNYLSWAERSRSFDAIGAFTGTGATLTGAGEPDVLGASLVTASLFRVLQVAPLAGRPLRDGDEQPAAPRVVVLGEGLWRARFGSDPDIVGRSITLDGQRHEVVGIMPRVFREVGRAQASGVAGAQVFLPMSIDRARESRGNHTLRVVGRLREGVPLEQARAEMRSVAAVLEREFPATNTNWSVRIDPLGDTTIEPHVRRSLLLVLGAVAMVFFIACANVANLMLVRGARRGPELALRTALGAGRSRLVRQLLTESGCLALASGAAGVLVAALTHPFLRSLLPSTVPRLEEMQLDLPVLGFGLVVSIASGIAVGVVPALRAARPDQSQSLVLAGRATADSTRVRVRQILVAAQIAAATMLLVGGALLLQGFLRLQRVPLGFHTEGVWTARISLPPNGYAGAERWGQFYAHLLEALRSAGHLQSAAIATSVPFAPGVRASFQPSPGANPGSPATSRVNAAEHIVSGEYFGTLGIPVLAGRPFNRRDVDGGAPVAIVSERLAALLWPGVSPLGQPIERDGRAYEVIGVVGDVRGADTQGLRGGGPDREPRAAAYFAAAQRPQRTMTVIVRASAEPAAILAAMRDTLRRVDPGLPLQQVRALGDWVSDSVAPARLTTRLAGLFAVSALLLASVGIYGVLAYTVASRTREIGVRIALGAARRQVVALVVRQGMTWASGGILVGLAGASGLAALMATLLFDVSARDPMTFAAVGAAVALAALAASTIPAARAVRTDPTIAMRAE